MSGLATAARTITWQRKPRRANLTACTPGVDVASPTLLFPAKQALGDRLVDKAPDGRWSWAALSVCCEGKVASSHGWGLEHIRCLRPCQTFLPACISGLPFG